MPAQAGAAVTPRPRAPKRSSSSHQARELSLEILSETQDDLESARLGIQLPRTTSNATRGKVETALEACGQSEQLARRTGDDELLLEPTADLCELHDRESERLARIDVKAVADLVRGGDARAGPSCGPLRTAGYPVVLFSFSGV